jgi:hypothetical protein
MSAAESKSKSGPEAAPEVKPVATSTSSGVSTPGGANGLAIAALVVGIVAVVSGWAPFWGVVVGAAAIVLGAIALKKHAANKGMAIAGLIMGAVGALWSLVISAFFIFALVTVGIGGAALTDAANKANQTINAYNADNQAKIDAKKDFAKGETANFDAYQVKVNSVKFDVTPNQDYYTPSDGKQFIAVNLTIKNISNDPITIDSFSLNDNGVLRNASYATVDPALESGQLAAGASTTGNVVYEVNADASSFKLQYSTYAYDSTTYASKTLTYTLAF